MNNILALAAQNELNVTEAHLQSTRFQLPTGSRINTGADPSQGPIVTDQNGIERTLSDLSQLAALG
ncbi:MAG: hypothetical protein ACRD1L_12685 [Terriglobales bacterium]